MVLSAVCIIIISYIFNSLRKRKWVSRCALITEVPMVFGVALAKEWPGAKARLLPLSPARTICSMLCSGTSSFATGQVSAHDQGLWGLVFFSLLTSFSVWFQEWLSSCCAIIALPCIQLAVASCHRLVLNNIMMMIAISFLMCFWNSIFIMNTCMVTLAPASRNEKNPLLHRTTPVGADFFHSAKPER